MIRALAGKLQALHLHDNDLWHDSHQIPFSMSIDFEGIVKTLKEIGYQGDFTLEADAYLGSYDKETIFKGIQNLADSAKKLRDLYFR
jgi:sugar phosphate isomerase/epimerase